MTKEEMKKIYEANPESWIALWSIPIGWMKHGKWFKTSTPNFIEEDYYKLVHIKHKDVLEAWLADNSVEIDVYDDNKWWNESSELFLYKYNPDLEYRLKEKEI